MRLPVVELSAATALFSVASTACFPDVEPNVFSLPRCDRVEPRCGPDGDESCCADAVVLGGTFNRVNDPQFPATVADFRLDRFEVTVGRFRQFVAGYPQNKPQKDHGSHPRLAGSGWDPGWDDHLPRDRAELEASLGCDPNFRTWTDGPGPNEELPINCVSWYVAFAFCAWDEARLPTKAEWNYAAAHGNEQRTYPWGEATPTPDLAAYGCDTTNMGCLIPRVGSRSPAGDGESGHADLAGSMSEWLLDYHGTHPTPCNDCANLSDKDEDNGREARGGDFAHSTEGLATTFELGFTPESREAFLGFRCAREK
ncbi:formylglycine-generating enzyme family protein [Polyangium jinanense]|nr:SUMF1/EgtB/PvdO family nonheme iron enzyme [Polyangium jinanense]